MMLPIIFGLALFLSLLYIECYIARFFKKTNEYQRAETIFQLTAIILWSVLFHLLH